MSHARGRLPPRGRDAGGFTLIEVLLATALRGAALALGFATLKAATATVNRDAERLSVRQPPTASPAPGRGRT